MAPDTILRLEKGDDFNTKRQFLLDYIQNVIYWDNKIELRGFVPVKSKAYADGETRSELGKLEFRISGHLSRIGGAKIERRPYASTQVIGRKDYDKFQSEIRSNDSLKNSQKAS